MTKESEIIKKRLTIFIGIAYLLLGFIVILQSFRGLTGFVIFEDVPQQIGWLAGVASIVVGIIVIAVSRGAVIVYDAKRARNKEHDYMLRDKHLLFGGEDLSLKEFKKEIHKLRESNDGEEMVNIVKTEYRPDLEQIVKDGGKNGEIAEEFLKVLVPSYKRREEEQEDNFRVSKEEKEEIKHAFRQFDGKLSTEQKNVLRKYNLTYDDSGRGPSAKIYYSGTEYWMTVGRTPSKPSGDYITHYLIGIIEQGRKHEKEKSKKAG